jgi:hypothetical protein
MHPGDRGRWWFMRHGFAAGVLLAAVGAIALGFFVPIPQELPSLAQGSATLWRVEQGGFSFVVFYVLVIAVALALKGRGFTEFGPGGVKTGDVVRTKKKKGSSE